MATLYRFHVRRKETGAWQTEHTFHEGDPPKPDDVIEANLKGKMVKAKVLVVIGASPDREEGEVTVEVYAAVSAL